MFGTANQLLAVVALSVGTTRLINLGLVRYAWTTLAPLVFVAVTTLWACVLNITGNFWPLTQCPATEAQGWINTLLTIVIMACALIVLEESVRRWWKIVVLKKKIEPWMDVEKPIESHTFRCC
jgi:carbon starvation protein